MTISKEAIAAAAREIYEAWGYAYEGRTINGSGLPYGNWERAWQAAERVLALHPAPSQICGACGEPWTGQTCAQKDNGWPHEVCFPVEAPSPAPHPSEEAMSNSPAHGNLKHFVDHIAALHRDGFPNEAESVVHANELRAAEAMRAKCEAICQRVMQNWRDASSGTGAVGIAYSNQASGAEQCLNAIAALKGNGEGL